MSSTVYLRNCFTGAINPEATKSVAAKAAPFRIFAAFVPIEAPGLRRWLSQDTDLSMWEIYPRQECAIDLWEIYPHIGFVNDT
jgi:hypothetical protein